MASENLSELVFKAKDEASEVIGEVAGELGILGHALNALATEGGIAGLALAAIGAAAGGIALVGKAVGESVEQLEQLSGRTNVSIQNLQTLEQVIKEAGGNTGSLAISLQYLNRAIATGNPLLAQLGIHSKDTFTAFVQLTKILDASGDAGKKTAIWMQLMGRTAGELLGSVHALATGTESMRDKLDELGITLGEGTVEQAKALNVEMHNLERGWAGVISRIQTVTLPWSVQIVKAFNDVWDAVRGVKPAFEEAESIITELEARIARLQKQYAFQSRMAEGKPSAQDAIDAPGAALGAKIGGGVVRAYYREQLANTTREMAAAANDLQLLKQGMDVGHHAIEEAQAAIGAARDSLSGISLDNQKVEEHTKLVEKLMNILHMTHDAAETAAKSLEAIEAAGQAEDITKKLTLGPEADESVTRFNAEIARTQALLGDTMQDALGIAGEVTDGLTLGPDAVAELKKFNDELQRTKEALKVSAEDALRLVRARHDDDTGDAATKQRERLGIQSRREIGPEEAPPGFKKPTATIVHEWMLTLDEITRSANVANETIGSIFNGLQQGFSTAFSGILSGALSLGGALKAVFKSIVDAIVSELARLAAVWVVKNIVLPAFGGGAGPASGARFVAQREIGRGGVAPSVVNNTYVSTYDARDYVREQTSMSGRQRQGQDRLTFLGEF